MKKIMEMNNICESLLLSRSKRPNESSHFIEEQCPLTNLYIRDQTNGQSNRGYYDIYHSYYLYNQSLKYLMVFMSSTFI
jgi:hypothetical protein